MGIIGSTHGVNASKTPRPKNVAMVNQMLLLPRRLNKRSCSDCSIGVSLETLCNFVAVAVAVDVDVDVGVGVGVGATAAVFAAELKLNGKLVSLGGKQTPMSAQP